MTEQTKTSKQFAKREAAVNEKAATIGLQLVKRTGSKLVPKPYRFEPLPTREANDQWGRRYADARYWLDEAEAELDRLTATN